MAPKSPLNTPTFLFVCTPIVYVIDSIEATPRLKHSYEKTPGFIYVLKASAERRDGNSF